MKLRHIIIILIFILINALVIFSIVAGNSGDKFEEKEDKVFVQTLSALKVKNEIDTFKVVGFGTVASFNAIDIASETQGQLNKGKYDLKPGISVRKGDLLFKINDTEAQYNLRAKKSNFINILASLLPDIKIDFPDEFSKWDNYIASIKLNEALPQLPSWRTNKEKIFLSTRNVLTEYFSIKSLETQTNKNTVYAPFNGVITEIYSTDYSVVAPGTRVLRIVENNNFEIPVAIPVIERENITIGTGVTIFNTEGQLKGKGTVVRISDVINQNTQSVEVYVRPTPLPGLQFTEGEYVQVEINEEGIHEGVRIPKTSISDYQVLIYSKKDSLLRKQAVSIYDTNNEGVFVKGVKDDAIVITQEVLNYSDTTKYQVLIK